MSFFFSFLLLFVSAKTPNTNINGYQPGDVATDFKLMSTDGDMVSLGDFPNAKGFIIIFTCNHCPFAIKYEDRMIDIAKRYRALGYEMIAINPNDPEAQPADSYELMKVRAEEKGFIFPYLFDEGQKIYPQYGATKTPHVYLLDKNRVVQYIGAIDDNVNNPEEVEEKYLENAILALENGQQPNPNMTKAIGCSIKVKK